MDKLTLLVLAILAIIAGATLSIPALVVLSTILVIMAIVAWMLYRKDVVAFIAVIVLGAVAYFLIIMWASYLILNA